MKASGPAVIGGAVPGAFLIFTCMSVAGYAVFGMNPGLFPVSEPARARYAGVLLPDAPTQLVTE